MPLARMRRAPLLALLGTWSTLLATELESSPLWEGTVSTDDGIRGEEAMADDPRKQPTAGPVRRRGAVLEEAILRAAVDELTESGYPGLTMDRVAKRAGTNKNAIYRRWPNRLALGVAAYRDMTTTV